MRPLAPWRAGMTRHWQIAYPPTPLPLARAGTHPIGRVVGPVHGRDAAGAGGAAVVHGDAGRSVHPGGQRRAAIARGRAGSRTSKLAHHARGRDAPHVAAGAQRDNDGIVGQQRQATWTVHRSGQLVQPIARGTPCGRAGPARDHPRVEVDGADDVCGLACHQQRVAVVHEEPLGTIQRRSSRSPAIARVATCASSIGPRLNQACRRGRVGGRAEA
jgi:hypothetical protein